MVTFQEGVIVLMCRTNAYWFRQAVLTKDTSFFFFSSFNFKNLTKCKTPTFPSLGITVSLFCLSSYSTAKGIFLITRSSSKMHR